MIPYSDTSADPDLDPANPKWPKDSKTWVLYTDGASSQSGYRSGIILTDPGGVECSHCFRFKFRAINNEAEYDALIARMGVAESLEADFLIVKSDSQLVVNQVSGLYQAKGDNMVG